MQVSSAVPRATRARTVSPDVPISRDAGALCLHGACAAHPGRLSTCADLLRRSGSASTTGPACWARTGRACATTSGWCTTRRCSRRLGATLKFLAGSVPASTIIALGLALLLYEKLPGIGFFRILVLLPFITPVVATTLVWHWVFNTQYGFLDSLLYALHLPTVDWFTSSFWSMVILVAYTVWHEVGFTILIMLAGPDQYPPRGAGGRGDRRRRRRWPASGR